MNLLIKLEQFKVNVSTLMVEDFSIILNPIYGQSFSRLAISKIFSQPPPA